VVRAFLPGSGGQFGVYLLHVPLLTNGTEREMDMTRSLPAEEILKEKLSDEETATIKSFIDPATGATPCKSSASSVERVVFVADPMITP
jgi:hypothetical protein